LKTRRAWRQAAWFVALWLGGVAVLGIVAMLIRAGLGL
jgi:hypothetical protein